MPVLLNELKDKKITLIGYGVSNKALGDYFIENKIKFTVRDLKSTNLPSGVDGFFGSDYLNINEEIVFRSPSVHPVKIPKGKTVFTEISYSLENAKGKKIGVTGSDGKTTTATIINKILEREHKSYLVGNIGAPLIRKINDTCKDDFIVSELSSFQLYDYTPTLDVAVITSISENHLDWHTSMADYVFSKRNILKKAKRAVVNYDSPYKEFFAHPNISYFSLYDMSMHVGNGASYTYVKNGYIYHNESKLFPLDFIKIKGRYNILNTLSAVSATIEYVSLDSIIEAVKEFEGVSHRAQTVAKINGITFIDSSIDSTPARTVSTLSSFPKEKSVIILGGYDKNLSYEILSSALKGVRAAILFGENKYKIQEAIKENPKKTVIVNNIFEATKVAYKEAINGDYVILSPSSASFDMFENYKERAEKFKEAIRGLENGKFEENSKHLDE